MNENPLVTDFRSPIRDTCLIILASVAITGALAYTKAVLVPFVFALFIFGITAPLISWFQNRLRLNRLLAVTLVAILFVMISSLLWLFIFNSIESFLNGADKYQARVIDFFAMISKNLETYGIQMGSSTLSERIQGLPLFSYATNITGTLFSIVGKSTLVIIFVLFLIAGKKQETPTPKIIDEIFSNVSRYITTKFLSSLTTGTLVWLILAILEVDLAFMFGVLTFLLNFIPSLGSIIATLLPLPIVYLQYDFGWTFIAAFLIPGAIQFTIGNIIEPKLLGEQLDLHPVAVLMFLIFWGIVWGIPGMFLAVPITAVVKIILYRIEQTRSVAELLSGRLTFK